MDASGNIIFLDSIRLKWAMIKASKGRFSKEVLKTVNGPYMQEAI